MEVRYLGLFSSLEHPIKPSTKAWPHAVAVRLFVPWMLRFGGLENWLKWEGVLESWVVVVVESFISLDVFVSIHFW